LLNDFKKIINNTFICLFRKKTDEKQEIMTHNFCKTKLEEMRHFLLQKTFVVND